MNRHGLYLYGFARPGVLGPLDVNGVVEGRQVGVIVMQGLAAVVSEVPLEAFEAALATGEPDPAWIVPRAVRHERVIEAVMALSPVLPVRFGALFSSPGALEGLVTAHREEIARFLDYYPGKKDAQATSPNGQREAPDPTPILLAGVITASRPGGLSLESSTKGAGAIICSHPRPTAPRPLGSSARGPRSQSTTPTRRRMAWLSR
jgi:gas vesicle protein GvpL/GvpF